MRDTPQRLGYVDGLRALCALWVAASHYLARPQTLLPPALQNVLFKVLGFNHVAVMVFLVVSGFCLYYPLCLKGPADPHMRVNYGEFMRRRAKRILPPYLAALGISLALTMLVPALSLLSRTPDGQHPLPVSGGMIISHLFLVHNLSPAWFGGIDYPVWTIGLEWQLYLLFPVVVYLFRKSVSGTLLASFGIALLIYIVTRNAGGTLNFALATGPWYYIFVFACGMCAARVIAGHNIPTLISANQWARGALWLCCAGAIVAVYRGSGGSLGQNCSSGIGSACLLLLAANPASPAHRLLSQRYLVQTGAYSYSIYLIHAPILSAVNLGFQSLHLKPDAQFVGFFLVGLPVLLLVAYGFHLVFERPFMATSRRQITASTVASPAL